MLGANGTVSSTVQYAFDGAMIDHLVPATARWEACVDLYTRVLVYVRDPDFKLIEISEPV